MSSIQRVHCYIPTYTHTYIPVAVWRRRDGVVVNYAWNCVAWESDCGRRDDITPLKEIRMVANLIWRRRGGK